MVRDIGSESPVISTVLEQIGDGHGGMGESMNKNSFQEAFRVV